MSAPAEAQAPSEPREAARDGARLSGVPRGWLWLGLIALAVLLYFAGRILLLGFAGLLLAVLLNAASAIVERRTPLSYRRSLAVVIAGLVVVCGLFIWQLEARLSQQIAEFSQSWPASLERLRETLDRFKLGYLISPPLGEPSRLIGGADTVQKISGAASTAAGVVVDLLVVLFVGLYAAAEPRLYKRGLRHLVPEARRDRVDEILHCLGCTLRWWIVGKLCSMAIVGTMSGVGLWLLGVKLALLLGLLAALFELIPNFGPFIAAVPAIMIAWTESSQLAVYVALLYLGVQLLESYIILPLVQRRAVELPPALVILAIVLLGSWAGVLGALVATPLLATVIVLVKMLYVEDHLGDHTAAVIGDGD